MQNKIRFRMADVGYYIENTGIIKVDKGKTKPVEADPGA
jgi:hypothetical protein